jgi:hypothetical protein
MFPLCCASKLCAPLLDTVGDWATQLEAPLPAPGLLNHLTTTEPNDEEVFASNDMIAITELPKAKNKDRHVCSELWWEKTGSFFILNRDIQMTY